MASKGLVDAASATVSVAVTRRQGSAWNVWIIPLASSVRAAWMDITTACHQRHANVRTAPCSLPISSSFTLRHVTYSSSFRFQQLNIVYNFIYILTIVFILRCSLWLQFSGLSAQQMQWPGPVFLQRRLWGSEVPAFRMSLLLQPCQDWGKAHWDYLINASYFHWGQTCHSALSND